MIKARCSRNPAGPSRFTITRETARTARSASPPRIAVSCNVYFAQLGIALGRDPMIALRHAGLDVGYAGELDPGGAGSRQLASTAFGQGALVINTMQAARMVAAIAAGGRYRRCSPTMELDAPCTEIVLVDDPAALAPITTGMRQVMTAGTGIGLRPPAGLRVYGKTGTADVHGFRGEEPFGIRPAAVAPPPLVVRRVCGNRARCPKAHRRAAGSRSRSSFRAVEQAHPRRDRSRCRSSRRPKDAGYLGR